MARTYADMVNLIEQKLQDTSNATFVAAEINYQVEECLKEFSTYRPHIIEVPFTIESRFGTASSTSSNNLVDSGKSQFVSGDATNEKVVYNDTDHTWATITSFSSSSQVGLSADIFTSGEAYYIFNRRCRNYRQLYIGDMFDFTEIIRAEYKVVPWSSSRNWRNIKYITPDVIELMIEFTPDDSDAAQTSSYTEVLMEVSKSHILCQLTDLSGAVNNGAGYSAGATSMAVDGLGNTETIEEGDEFHIAGHRRVYVITTDVNTSGNAATISFYPGLEAAVSDDDVITFVRSSLQPNDEDLFADLVAARLVLNHATAFLNTVNKGGAGVFSDFINWGERRLSETLSKIRRNSKPRTKVMYPTL